MKSFYFGEHRLNFSDAMLSDDGTLLITGYSHRDSAGTNKLALYGSRDLWLIKLKKNLTLDWIKCFGGNRDESNPKIIQYKNGYLLVCESNSYLSGNKKSSGSGNTDLWLLHLDTTGNVIWQESYWADNFYSVLDILVLPQDRILIAGKNEIGAFILEADSTGIEIQKKVYTSYDGFFDINLLENGMLIANAYQTNGDQGLSQHINQVVLKIDTVLNATNLLTYPHEVATTANSVSFISPGVAEKNYILTNTKMFSVFGDSLNMSTNLSDYRVIKLNQSGQNIWDKTFGGNQSEILIHSINTSDNNIILSGYSNSSRGGDKTEILHDTHVYQYWIIALDMNGNKVWDKIIPGTTKNLSPRKIIEISAGSYYCIGTDDTGISIARINYKRI